VTKIQLFSEPFAKTGNIAAEGFKKLLGRPTLGLLQTLIRESIQNVLDATQSDSGARVLIRLRTLNALQLQALRESVFAERPNEIEVSVAINSSLQKPELRVLEICDFGTEGLSGPTRGDAAHEGMESLNFINFLRNVGSVQGSVHSGGTYGYGKSSLYAISRCSTIIVDSQTQHGDQHERRFMACHLGMEFDANNESGERCRFTGRHWWGELSGTDYVEPIVNDNAKNYSLMLGMATRTPNQKGTSILIIDPDIHDDDYLSAGDDIVEAVLWNFWPRMVETTPANRRLQLEVEVDGKAVIVSKPEQCPPLDLFASAIASHRNKSKDLVPIWCERPKTLLGNLYIQKGMRADRVGSALREHSIIPKQSRHIALMRPFELVVKYIEGVPFSDSRFDWAGVFICSDDSIVEEAFAASEPPAHDDWIPENLPKGPQKTFVNVALRHLKEIARPQTSAANLSNVAGQKGDSLASTATKLGGFLGNVSSKGAGKPERKPNGPQKRKTTRVSTPRFDGLTLNERGVPIARFIAELENDGTDSNLYLVAEPYFVADGGAITSDDLPEQYVLNIQEMTVGELSMTGHGPWIHIAAQGGQVVVMVPTIPDAAISIKLHLQTGSPT
jgi:hypothetical protein